MYAESSSMSARAVSSHSLARLDPELNLLYGARARVVEMCLTTLAEMVAGSVWRASSHVWMADFQVLGSPGKISVSVVPSGTKNPVAERCKTRRQLHLWLPQPDPRNLRSLQLHCASTQRCENLSTSSREIGRAHV